MFTFGSRTVHVWQNYSSRSYAACSIKINTFKDYGLEIYKGDIEINYIIEL